MSIICCDAAASIFDPGKAMFRASTSPALALHYLQHHIHTRADADADADAVAVQCLLPCQFCFFFFFFCLLACAVHSRSYPT